MRSEPSRPSKSNCKVSILRGISPYFGLILLLIIGYACQKDSKAQQLEPVWDISVRDNENRGSVGDIEVNFSKQYNTEAIELYRIYILKPENMSVQDISFFESLSEAHYTEVAPADIYPVQGKVLKQQMVDTNGDLIVEGIPYRAAVVSVPKNADLWLPSLAYSEEDLILTQNNLVKPYSSSLEAGAGSLASNAQGAIVMGPYNIIDDLTGNVEEESPIYYFNAPPSFSAPNRSFSLMGGSAFDSQGILYLANTFAGQILKVTPTGAVQPLDHSGEELRQPDGLFINTRDEMFVTDRATGAVIKILPDGTSSQVAVTKPGVRGITGDDIGNLYVTINQENGQILKISPDGEVTNFAQIPTFVPADYIPTFIMWVGYLTYHQGALYVAGTSTHRIYKVDAAGTVSVFAGSGTKLLPVGDALTAHFNRPMGVAFSEDGKRLIVSGCIDVTPLHVQASKPSRIYQIEIL